MKTPRIEIFEGRSRLRRRRFYFRVVAANGEIVAASEAYTRRVDAVRGANDLRSTVQHNVCPIVISWVVGSR